MLLDVFVMQHIARDVKGATKNPCAQAAQAPNMCTLSHELPEKQSFRDVHATLNSLQEPQV